VILLNIGRHHERKSRPSDLLRQQHNVVAFPDRRHLRPDGKDKMDLVCEQRLHRDGRAAHKDQLQFQSLALEETSLRRDH